MKNLIVRPFKIADLQAVIHLFKEAVAAINVKHYTLEQIAVWTDIDETGWQEKLTKHISFVAEIDSVIIGFIDMARDGYLDHLYIHKDYQVRFVSLRLLKAIEKEACQLGLIKIVTDCSITAKTPAERVGFRVIREQVVEKKGVRFINYRMEKELY